MTPGAVDRLIIRSDLSELEGLFAFIDRFCDASSVPNEVKYRLFLVIEELTVNIMRYGYGQRTDGPIEIALRRAAGQVEVRVEDEAPAFDPLKQAQSSPTDAALADRPIGGLGVHLIKTLAQSMSYDFKGGRNIISATLNEAA